MEMFCLTLLVSKRFSVSSLCGCGWFLWHTFWVVGFVGFLVWVVFCLLFGWGAGAFGFTSMLVWLVLGVGHVEVGWLCIAWKNQANLFLSVDLRVMG